MGINVLNLELKTLAAVRQKLHLIKTMADVNGPRDLNESHTNFV